MKHIPGPWKAARNSAFWEVVKPWPGQTLEEANDYSPSVAHAWGTTEQEAEANARLIAAAPDLLNSAVMALECLRQRGLDSGQVGASLEIAIAKATGEEA